ncbi:hypothetical protein GL213_07070 [Halogeometricum borinquense]|uniref:Uncharacterized protein n=2 Tax=Halogeometricum borinquense TaxID=60847 RepID=E4NT03_HALBP|nr:hypothetical protein [Halogeometricum borinquense]ADQ66996.1 hypothetical protein Hbor_14160 [Halogeometricum borinquense DSM 11551]ELY29788.1 hypothetical protein C499_04536 [Halogeometricum borinquense DSM 11551]QIB74746.1 hypothetical protein G3I44_10890 [Halogeometricum borinquense]QIQ76299.1 hypothetical protein GL213_07070 [Halogeometricum borinquense]
MGLDELTEDVETAYADLDEESTVSFDRETRHELAMLAAAFETDETDELVRRAVHLLFQTTVDRGTLDFHLRQGYDVTYDEYLSGMTYEEMTGQNQYPQRDDERRYQM